MAEQISNHITDDVADDVKAAYVEHQEPVAAPEPKAEATEEKTDTRDRDESGRFKAKDTGDEPKDEPKTVDKPVEVKPEDAPKVFDDLEKAQEKPPTVGGPPRTWSIKSKAEWDKLPQHVREDAIRRETEIDSGYKDLEGLRPYRERAKASGQSLQQVLQNYTGIEDLLRTDPRSGYLRIASNSGMTQHQAAQFFAGLAQDLGHQTPQAPTNQNGFGGSPASESGADPNALYQMFRPMVDPLMQEVQELKQWKQTYTSQVEAQESQRLHSTIEQFRQDPKYRYFNDVKEDMAALFRGGSVPENGDLIANLAVAYEKACWQNPEVRQILIDERTAKLAEEKAKAAKEAADKARQASKSVSGSPSPGASTVSKPNKASHEDDVYADVRDAFNSSVARA